MHSMRRRNEGGLRDHRVLSGRIEAAEIDISADVTVLVEDDTVFKAGKLS